MFPDRTREIIESRNDLQNYLKENNFEKSRGAFNRLIESLKQQNVNTDGKFEKELEDAKKAFSDFAKTDPLYLKVLNLVIPEIKKSPRILQTEIYKLFPNIIKDNISYTIYFAADHDIIKRTKKGRTYSLELS